MPNRSDHEREAQHNEDFYQEIDSAYQDYRDWVIVGRFYTAVHYIDAQLADDGIHPESHRERFQEIQNSYQSELNQRLYSNFNTLYDLSKQARYHCIDINEGLLNSSRIALNNIKTELGV